MEANEVNRNENKYRRRRSEEDANNMDLDFVNGETMIGLDRRKECSKEKKITIQFSRCNFTLFDR